MVDLLLQAMLDPAHETIRGFQWRDSIHFQSACTALGRILDLLSIRSTDMNQGLKMDGVKLRQDFGNAVSQTVEGDGGTESGGSVLLTLHLASFNTPTSRGRLVVKGSWDLISGN